MRDSYGVARRRGATAAAVRGNSFYDSAKQVSAAEMQVARDVLQRMLEGGELLAAVEVPRLKQALPVLDEAVAAAGRRALRDSQKPGISPLEVLAPVIEAGGRTAVEAWGVVLAERYAQQSRIEQLERLVEQLEDRAPAWLGTPTSTRGSGPDAPLTGEAHGRGRDKNFR